MQPPIVWPTRALVSVLLLVGVPALRAVDCHWTNPLGGTWSDTANWDTHAVPGPADNVFITADGTYTVTLDVDTTIASLTVGGPTGVQSLVLNARTLTLNGPGTLAANTLFTLSGGTLGGSGTLTVNGTMTWTGGLMTGLGVTEIADGATLAISGAGQKVWHSRTLRNAGAVTIAGTGLVSTGSGATLDNLAGGVIDLQADTAILYDQGGTAPVIGNAGRLRKSGGTGTSALGGALNNSGIVTVEAATLSFSGGGNSSGAFEAQAGTTLVFSGGTATLTAASSVTGAGTVAFTGGSVALGGACDVTGAIVVSSGGTANFNGAASAATCTLSSGGTLGGSGTLTVNGTMTWTGGSMYGFGILAIAEGATLDIPGAGQKVWQQHTIRNAGTVMLSGTGLVSTGSSATLDNLAGGVIDLQTDAAVAYDLGGNPPAIHNAGRLRKSGGTGTSALGGALNNSGTVTVEVATLSFSGGGNSSGAFEAQAGATLAFAGGTATLTAASSVTGAGTVAFTGGSVALGGACDVTGAIVVSSGGTANFNGAASAATCTLSSGGTLGGSGTLTVNGTMTWTGGSMYGFGILAIAEGATLDIPGAGQKVWQQHTIRNAGTVMLSGTGLVSTGSSATLDNLAGGVIDLQTDAAVAYDLGGNPPAIHNAGRLRKSGGTGTSALGGALNNSGTVTVEVATLSFSGGGNSSGAFEAQAGTTLVFSGGTATLTAASSVTGAGTVAFTGGSVALGGACDVTGAILVSSGGTANFNGDASAATCTLSSGGTLGGSGTLTVNGTMTWTGGSMYGFGILAIDEGATLDIPGAGQKVWQQHTIRNAGTVMLSGTGLVSTGSSATLDNLAGGVIDLQTDAAVAYDLGGNPPAIHNAGRLRKSGGTGTSALGGALNNSGTVTVEVATLSFSGGGNSSGAFEAQAGTTLVFSGGTATLTAASSVTGAGTVAFTGGSVALGGACDVTGAILVSNGGTANFNGAASAATCTLSSGGTLGGSGTLTVNGTMTWTGGSMYGFGILAIDEGATLDIPGAGQKVWQQHTIRNAGTVMLSGTGLVSTGSSATLDNLAGGVIDLQTDAAVAYDLGGNPPAIHNAGRLRKSGGTGTSALGGALNNSGTVTVEVATLSFSGGGNSSGAFEAQAGTTLVFSGGTATLTAASSVTGAGTVAFTGGSVALGGACDVTGAIVVNGGTANFNNTASAGSCALSSGTLGGSGTLTVNGTMAWTGGLMAGLGVTEIADGATLAISGTGQKVWHARTLRNAGTVTIAGTGLVSTGSGATLDNLAGGVVDLQADTAILYDQGGAPPVIDNAGRLRKSGGTGTSALGGTLNNRGTVDIQTGTVNAAGGLAHANGAVIQGAGTLNVSGTTFMSQGAYRPGSPIGQLTVLPRLPLSSGSVIEIELGGTVAGQTYDRLEVVGQASLTGTLKIELADGFVPASGDTFEVMRFTSHTGTFADYQGLDVGQGMHLRPTITDTSVILTAVLQATVSFAAGWNAVSLPLEPANPAIESVLAAPDGRGTIHSGAVWQWVALGTAGDGYYQAVAAMRALAGYMVYCPAAATITIDGAAVANRLDLHAGWTLAGPAAASQVPVDAPRLSVPVWYLNPASGGYSAVRPGGSLAPGAAYWFHAAEPFQLDLTAP